MQGRVVAASAHWDDAAGTIYTFVTIDVVKSWGLPGAPPRVIVKQLGGIVGDTAFVVGGQARFEVGEDVLVFLDVRPRDNTLSVAGLEQGKWVLTGSADAATAAAREIRGHDQATVVAREYRSAVAARCAGGAGRLARQRGRRRVRAGGARRAGRRPRWPRRGRVHAALRPRRRAGTKPTRGPGLRRHAVGRTSAVCGRRPHPALQRGGDVARGRVAASAERRGPRRRAASTTPKTTTASRSPMAIRAARLPTPAPRWPSAAPTSRRPTPRRERRQLLEDHQGDDRHRQPGVEVVGLLDRLLRRRAAARARPRHWLRPLRRTGRPSCIRRSRPAASAVPCRRRSAPTTWPAWRRSIRAPAARRRRCLARPPASPRRCLARR